MTCSLVAREYAVKQSIVLGLGSLPLSTFLGSRHLMDDWQATGD